MVSNEFVIIFVEEDYSILLFSAIQRGLSMQSASEETFDCIVAFSLTVVMSASSYIPEHWGTKIPPHWREGCIFSWSCGDNISTDSQCGQDLVVEYLTDISANRLFLDLGANDGVTGSSTYRLEKNGWRGMLVEPNVKLFPSLVANRKKSILFSCAVGNVMGVMTLQTSNVHTLGTLVNDRESYQFQRLSRESGGIQEIQMLPVPVMPLEDILNTYSENFDAYPDFLKIDVEGFEIQTVESLVNTSCNPSIIEIENNERGSDVANMLRQSGYSLQIVMDSFVEIWSLRECDKTHLARLLS